ncbi:MAG: HDOD domain-containing protein [Planctomycetota bacterium]|jgi:HD-like signal output (HDOD) protein|nr:HDOD domain-containing protein [Planctomycetota bacterium]
MTDADFNIHEVKSRIAQIGELFSLPDVIVRLEQLTRSQSVSATDIARAIESDVALAAKIMKVVNSPFYGFNRVISSINYAIVILGFKAMRNLVLSAFVAGKCENTIPEFPIVDFWRYAVDSAAATEEIARFIDSPDSGNAFVAGLLNKIGLIVMNQYYPADLAAAVQKKRAENIPLMDAEMELWQFTHYDLGAQLLDHWNMPAAVVEACRDLRAPTDNSSHLCWLCHLANILTQALGFGATGDELIARLAPGCLQQLNLPLPKIPEVMAQVVKKIRAQEQCDFD